MVTELNQLLSSKSGFVRKAAAVALRVPRWWRGRVATPGDFRHLPPVLADSFPKSGTHLVNQIVDGLPGCRNYGAFIGSMISSYQFRERTPDNVSRFVASIVPGEIVRGHLFYDPQNAADLTRKNVVHYFVYRDPRAVVVSEAHYLREMNRWHRLHKYFAALPSIEEAISLSIKGFDPPVPGIDYPNISERFARYAKWMNDDDCLTIRFEDLRSEQQPEIVRQMVEFYAAHCEQPIDVDACVSSMIACVAPEKSHTFRSGKKAGWAKEFTAEHRAMFDRVAGNLLIDLGYETNRDWATVTTAS